MSGWYRDKKSRTFMQSITCHPIGQWHLYKCTHEIKRKRIARILTTSKHSAPVNYLAHLIEILFTDFETINFQDCMCETAFVSVSHSFTLMCVCLCMFHFMLAIAIGLYTVLYPENDTQLHWNSKVTCFYHIKLLSTASDVISLRNFLSDIGSQSVTHHSLVILCFFRNWNWFRKAHFNIHNKKNYAAMRFK